MRVRLTLQNLYLSKKRQSIETTVKIKQEINDMLNRISLPLPDLNFIWLFLVKGKEIRKLKPTDSKNYP